MPRACGNAVHESRTSLWVFTQPMHKTLWSAGHALVKLVGFTQFCSQLSTKICTLFTHIYTTFTSVATGLYTQSTGPIYNQSKLNKGFSL